MKTTTAKLTAPLKWHGVDYRPIPGFMGYRAGSDGTIWSSWRASGRPLYIQVMGSQWKLLRPDCRKEDGRKRYTLKANDASYVRKYASHFVLLAFVGPRPPGMECCHGNGNCLDDNAMNLRWDTSVANKVDMLRHGTRPSGERHPKAKISDGAIPVILAMRNQGRTYRAIGKVFGVTEQRIFQICRKGQR